MNNVTDIFFNDITELDFDTFGVLFTRIRLITGLNQFICTFDKENINKNHWIYEYVFGNVNNEDDFIKYLKEELVKFGINKNQYLSDDYKQDIASTNVI